MFTCNSALSLLSSLRVIFFVYLLLYLNLTAATANFNFNSYLKQLLSHVRHYCWGLCGSHLGKLFGEIAEVQLVADLRNKRRWHLLLCKIIPVDALIETRK